jgi:hypothetical protein
LGDLSNVDATITTETGKTSVLKWNATTSRYETGTFIFNQLKGIDLTGLGDKDLLIYDNVTKVWKPLALKTNGELIIGGTTGPSVATLTAGTNVTVTNGSGSITISAPNVVTGVTGVSPIAVTGTTAPIVSITAATTSLSGSMSAADKLKLDGIAAGAEVNVNADWNAVSGDAQILNKPTILSLTQVTGKTVATGAWSLVSGFYEASISDGNITASSVVDVIPDNASASIVATAELLPRTDSSSGAVKIYANNLPSGTITVTINILK